MAENQKRTWNISWNTKKGSFEMRKWNITLLCFEQNY